MANTVICAELQDGWDLSCVRTLASAYYQELVLINFNDIDRTASVNPTTTGATCDYAAHMVLKPGKKGVQIMLPQNGTAAKGTFEKKTSDKGFVGYIHKVGLLTAGLAASDKCKLDKLDHGRFVAVLQSTDGTVEIYGWQNGLTTADYTFDLVDGGGANLLTLQSNEKAPEGMLPLVYKPAASGDAGADFNDQFAAP